MKHVKCIYKMKHVKCIYKMKHVKCIYKMKHVKCIYKKKHVKCIYKMKHVKCIYKMKMLLRNDTFSQKHVLPNLLEVSLSYLHIPIMFSEGVVKSSCLLLVL